MIKETGRKKKVKVDFLNPIKDCDCVFGFVKYYWVFMIKEWYIVIWYLSSSWDKTPKTIKLKKWVDFEAIKIHISVLILSICKIRWIHIIENLHPKQFLSSE